MATTVLLVDDSPDLRAIYATLLRHHGIRVVEADTAEDALRRASEDAVTVVVVNARTGDGGGWRLLGDLALHPRTLGIPVIVLCDRGEAPRAGGGPGATRLVQPVEPRALLEAVIASADQRRQSSA